MRVSIKSGALTVATALLACCLGALGARAAAASLPVSSRWKAGVNYKILSPAQPTNAPAGKVQVIEFFYLACPFCHALEPHIVAWRKHKPSYVQFEQVPVMWAPLQQADARFYYTLLAVGRDDLVPTTFNTLHRLEQAAGGDENVMIGDTAAKTLALQEAFAERHGVPGSAFANAYHSFDVQVELDRARQLGNVYQITATPTIIVDGRFKTGPSYFSYHGNESRLASGDRRVIALINFLTRWVHDHPQAG
jgi:thiol:disulfide interchange protein DsbA